MPEAFDEQISQYWPFEHSEFFVHERDTVVEAEVVALVVVVDRVVDLGAVVAPVVLLPDWVLAVELAWPGVVESAEEDDMEASEAVVGTVGC